MRREWLVLPLAVALLLPAVIRADYLRVSRPAILRTLPKARAIALDSLERGDLLTLLDSGQTNGYYHAKRSGGEAGWIYRTLVRRNQGDLPVEAGGPSEAEVTLPEHPATPPAAGEVLDASAFRRTDCPPEGKTKVERIKELNILKNRAVGPAPSQVSEISLDDLLYPGDDRDRWKTSYAAEVSGYVKDVKVGGVETCNCKATTPAERDTHIELVRDPGSEEGEEPVIVEVTPTWRKFMASRGTDWSTDKIRSAYKGKWIRVRGWMLFDSEHVHQADNTNPNGAKNWRGTAWEIHPITGLEVVATP